MQKYVLCAFILRTVVSCSSLDVTDCVLSSYKAVGKKKMLLFYVAEYFQKLEAFATL